MPTTWLPPPIAAALSVHTGHWKIRRRDRTPTARCVKPGPLMISARFAGHVRVPTSHDVLPSEALPLSARPATRATRPPHAGAIRAEVDLVARTVDSASRQLRSGADRDRADASNDRAGRSRQRPDRQADQQRERPPPPRPRLRRRARLRLPRRPRRRRRFLERPSESGRRRRSAAGSWTWPSSRGFSPPRA